MLSSGGAPLGALVGPPWNATWLPVAPNRPNAYGKFNQNTGLLVPKEKRNKKPDINDVNQKPPEHDFQYAYIEYFMRTKHMRKRKTEGNMKKDIPTTPTTSRPSTPSLEIFASAHHLALGILERVVSSASFCKT